MELSVIQFIIGFVLLGIAAYQDLKTRLVSTVLWIIMAFAGMLILSYQIVFLWHVYFYMLYIPFIFLVFFEWYLEHIPAFLHVFANLTGFFGGLVVLAIMPVSRAFALFIVIIIILISKLLFRFKLLRGKADARAIMAISILIPYYPLLFTTFSLPTINRQIAELTFPFALEVLMNAVIMLIFYILCLFFYNIIKGDFGIPEMFLGYRENVENLPNSKVWLLERLTENGSHYLSLRPDEDSELEELRKFKEKNIQYAWVQPKIPFVFFIFLGFIIGFVIDDLAIFYIL